MALKLKKPLIRDKDKGWAKVKAEINSAASHSAVGVFGAKAAADHGGLPNIKVALTHEFGATIRHPGGTAYIPQADGSVRFVSNAAAEELHLPRTRPHDIVIPRRSFVRDTVDMKRRQIAAIIRNLAAQVLVGKMDREKALEIVGVFVQGLIRQRISQGIPPPNAPSTIARKRGSAKPLIDTGQLRASIDHEVRPGIKSK